MRLHDGLHIARFPDGRTEILAGVEPILCFKHLSHPQAEVLSHLARGCSRPDLKQLADTLNLPMSQVSALLGILSRAELLELRAPRHPGGPDESSWNRVGGKSGRDCYRKRRQRSVCLNSASRIAQLIALELASAGIGKLCFPTQTKSGELGIDIPQHRARNLGALLESRGLKPLISSRSETADLAIKLAWGFPDLLELRLCLALSQPYLPIIAGHDFVEVGPIVVPGLTPCAYCTLLEKQQREPDFIRRMLSLNRDCAPRIETALAASSAAVAAGLVLAFLDGRRCADATGYRLSLDGRVETLTRRFHPDCGCGYRDSRSSPESSASPASPGCPDSSESGGLPAASPLTSASP